MVVFLAVLGVLLASATFLWLRGARREQAPSPKPGDPVEVERDPVEVERDPVEVEREVYSELYGRRSDEVSEPRPVDPEPRPVDSSPKHVAEGGRRRRTRTRGGV